MLGSSNLRSAGDGPEREKDIKEKFDVFVDSLRALKELHVGMGKVENSKNKTHFLNVVLLQLAEDSLASVPTMEPGMGEGDMNKAPGEEEEGMEEGEEGEVEEGEGEGEDGVRMGRKKKKKKKGKKKKKDKEMDYDALVKKLRKGMAGGKLKILPGSKV